MVIIHKSLTPLNKKYSVLIYDKEFITPLHYLYYYIYASTHDEKEAVLKTKSAEELLSMQLQFKDVISNEMELNRKVYTLITYLYMFHEDFRNAVLLLSTKEDRINMAIKNDAYFGYPGNKWGRAIMSFRKAILIQ